MDQYEKKDLGYGMKLIGQYLQCSHDEDLLIKLTPLSTSHNKLYYKMGIDNWVITYTSSGWPNMTPPVYLSNHIPSEQECIDLLKKLKSIGNKIDETNQSVTKDLGYRVIIKGNYIQTTDGSYVLIKIIQHMEPYDSGIIFKTSQFSGYIGYGLMGKKEWQKVLDRLMDYISTLQ